MKRGATSTSSPAAEAPALSDAERRERLEQLAERLLQPDGFDHDTLERRERLEQLELERLEQLEQLSDDEQ